MPERSLSEIVRARFPEAVLAVHSYRGDHTVTIRPENLLGVARFLKEDPSLQMNFLMDLTAVDYLTFEKQTQPQGAFVSSGIQLRQPMNVPDDPAPPVLRSRPEEDETAVPKAPAPSDPDRLTTPVVNRPLQIPGELPEGANTGGAGWPGRAAEDRFEVVYHFFSLSLQHRLRVKVPVPHQQPEVDSLTPLWASADWFEREVWDMYGIRFRGHPSLKRILMYESFEGHPLRKDYPVNKRQPLIGPVN